MAKSPNVKSFQKPGRCRRFYDLITQNKEQMGQFFNSNHGRNMWLHCPRLQHVLPQIKSCKKCPLFLKYFSVYQANMFMKTDTHILFEGLRGQDIQFVLAKFVF